MHVCARVFVRVCVSAHPLSSRVHIQKRDCVRARVCVSVRVCQLTFLSLYVCVGVRSLAFAPACMCVCVYVCQLTFLKNHSRAFCHVMKSFSLLP